VDAADCRMCAPGTFAATRRAPACAACPTGTYANSWGSTHCAHCIIGTHAPRAVRAPAHSPAPRPVPRPAPPRTLAGARPAPRACPRAPGCCSAWRAPGAARPRALAGADSGWPPLRGSLQGAAHTRGACARGVCRLGSFARPAVWELQGRACAKTYTVRAYILPHHNAIRRARAGRAPVPHVPRKCDQCGGRQRRVRRAGAAGHQPDHALRGHRLLRRLPERHLARRHRAQGAPAAAPGWARRPACLRPTLSRCCGARRCGPRPRASIVPAAAEPCVRASCCLRGARCGSV